MKFLERLLLVHLDLGDDSFQPFPFSLHLGAPPLGCRLDLSAGVLLRRLKVVFYPPLLAQRGGDLRLNPGPLGFERSQHAGLLGLHVEHGPVAALELFVLADELLVRGHLLPQAEEENY